jgi:hypothetical protein
VTSAELGQVGARLALDLVAIAILVYGVYLPRHRRMDLAVAYALFNLGLFLALSVIMRGDVTLGVGLGLFAVLSMVRLRSETYSNRELAYFFVALAIALVTAVDAGSFAFAAGLTAIALLGAWAVDHPRVSRRTRRLEVTLEMVFKDQEAMRRHLEERLDAEVLETWPLEIDYVRETTRAAVRYAAGPHASSMSEEAFDATVAAPRR